jgi:hypothetical protein
MPSSNIRGINVSCLNYYWQDPSIAEHEVDGEVQYVQQC